MLVRCKFDDAVWEAKLTTAVDSTLRRRFILQLRDSARRHKSVGRFSATIGYELISCTPSERAALTLARFQLETAGRNGNSLAHLARLLRAPRVTPPRSSRGPARKAAIRATAPNLPELSEPTAALQKKKRCA
jgi:hypothetical protein